MLGLLGLPGAVLVGCEGLTRRRLSHKEIAARMQDSGGQGGIGEVVSQGQGIAQAPISLRYSTARYGDLTKAIQDRGHLRSIGSGFRQFQGGVQALRGLIVVAQRLIGPGKIGQRDPVGLGLPRALGEEDGLAPCDGRVFHLPALKRL